MKNATTAPIIRKFRKKSLGLSVPRAARALGIGAGTWYAWETGPNSPDLNAVRLMYQNDRFRPLASMLLDVPGRLYD